MYKDDIIPETWSKLGPEDRSSTVAYFKIGFESDCGKEVLVWKGVEEEGDVVLELPSDKDVPDSAEYVIEFLDKGDLKSMRFADCEREATRRAVQKVIIESGRQ